jgi:hypothetical protein
MTDLVNAPAINREPTSSSAPGNFVARSCLPYFTLRNEANDPAPMAETAALAPVPILPAASVIVPVF